MPGPKGWLPPRPFTNSTPSTTSRSCSTKNRHAAESVLFSRTTIRGLFAGMAPNQSGSVPPRFGGEITSCLARTRVSIRLRTNSMARRTPVVFVHSAGNDGVEASFPSTGPWFPHAHVDDNTGDVLTARSFAIHKWQRNRLSDSDMLRGRPTVRRHNIRRMVHRTIGLLSAVKNVIAVAPSTNFCKSLRSALKVRRSTAASSRHRRKVSHNSPPSRVGVSQHAGNSMSSPGDHRNHGNLTEQWRKTFGGRNPDPEALKVSARRGSRRSRKPRSRIYTYGFGLANAQASSI